MELTSLKQREKLAAVPSTSSQRRPSLSSSGDFSSLSDDGQSKHTDHVAVDIPVSDEVLGALLFVPLPELPYQCFKGAAVRVLDTMQEDAPDLYNRMSQQLCAYAQHRSINLAMLSARYDAPIAVEHDAQEPSSSTARWKRFVPNFLRKKDDVSSGDDALSDEEISYELFMDKNMFLKNLRQAKTPEHLCQKTQRLIIRESLAELICSADDQDETIQTLQRRSRILSGRIGEKDNFIRLLRQQSKITSGVSERIVCALGTALLAGGALAGYLIAS